MSLRLTSKLCKVFGTQIDHRKATQKVKGTKVKPIYLNPRFDQTYTRFHIFLLLCFSFLIDKQIIMLQIFA